MKNICFVIHNLTCKGGTERVGTTIANELSRLGYGVSIISYDARTNTSFFPVDPQIKTGIMLSNIFERRTRRWKWYASWKLRRWLKKHRVDVVIDIDTIHALWTWKAIKDTGIKWISWDHFNLAYALQNQDRIEALRLVANHADKLVLLSKADCRAYAEKAIVPIEKTVQIYNPLSFECADYTPRLNKKAISVLRIDPQKGPDLLLQAWRIVENESREWALNIVCGYGDYEELQKEADSMGLKRIRCLPPSNDVKRDMSEAGIYALPSRFEGFGLVLTEAATAGLPAVAFNCPYGPNEIITDGVDGILVEPENVEKFAHALLSLMNDDEMRLRIGEAAHKSAKRFSTDVIVPQWVKLIESL